MTEWLSVEHRPSRHRLVRTRRALALVALLVIGLAGSGRSPSCLLLAHGDRYGSDEPEIQGLRFSALARPHESQDDAPTDLMPKDMTGSTRRVLETTDVRVFLAAGQGFTCLAVEGRGRFTQTSNVCLLNAGIGNDGLAVVVSSNGPDQLLVLALPDGTHLAPQTRSPGDLTSAPNVVVVRESSEVAPVWVMTGRRTFPGNRGADLDWSLSNVCLS